MTDILNFFADMLVNFFNLILLIGSSLINGLQFFFAMFTNIPKYFFDLFYELPSFFRIGLSGVLGLLLLVVILKLVAIISIK